MNTPDLIRLLSDAYRDRLTLLSRHVAGAREVTDYDTNNTYQYVINREEQHLQWLQSALQDMDTAVPEPAAVPGVPADGSARDRSETIAKDDARLLGEFADRWRVRVETATNARIRTMLRVIVGEAIEHQRLFDQAAAGNRELLGRRTGGDRVPGAVVMSSRWTGD